MIHMEFETFEQVVKYMDSFASLRIKCSENNNRIQRMTRIAQVLGNPQNYYKTIHLAGSKGKGSTAAFIANSIQSLGYRTGLYLSPHVTDYRERFTLSGSFFDDKILVRTGNLLARSVEKLDFAPSVFEMYTSFAFLLFREAGCEWAVIETGLGGRYDATNILNPQAVVFTPIELEHTEILGDTIETIAVEKSKIIKPDIPVFISLQKKEVMDVFLREAEANNCPVFSLSDSIRKISRCTTEDRENVLLEIDGIELSLKLKMMGKVQGYNCALALLVLNRLGLFKKDVTQKALENTVIPGRMEKFKGIRTVFIDGAHTMESIKNLMISFREIYPSKTGICIFGCAADKKYEWMSKYILDNFDKVVVSKPGTFKKSNPEALFNYMMSVKSYNQLVMLEEDTSKALELCYDNTCENEPVLVCGSFYLAGCVKEVLCL